MDLRHRSAEVDGALICRTDGTGRRIAVLPSNCKVGRHTLAVTDGAATVHAGEVLLICPHCAAIPGVDHTWRLTFSGPSPERAELDDEPYRHLRQRAARALAHR